ncbi:NADH-quinone oxidoreductase subunit NuoN [Mycobacterium sp. OTB74]|jgi:NADH-quinone oxidoreductase subunit N|uniref:NADH-quinone oxidoreductase subunit NuoN n=1 Tax=Mycobacterium sp. OTB74 TaxID=1853452 RepID=UPI0024771791|nr:NADH-quinone oxidoreductase subunit NuoN [Mycobacterium sp. OTB74]MDH6242612.1 NADH-quinone oxidoreductase subunit N [Mycobacterium sp. OTB74]
MTTLQAPSVEYGLLSPMLIVFGMGLAGVLVEAFAPRTARYGIQVVLSLGGQLAALAAVIVEALQLGSAEGRHAVLGAVAIDRPALFLQGTLLGVGLLATLLIAQRVPVGPDTGGGLVAFTPQASSVPGSTAELVATKAGVTQTEIFPLTMFALGGMMLFGASDDLLSMFVALEVLSLPLYLMCGLARRRRLLSQEASLKYFLLGAFSSGFFLYGVAMLYGYSGTLSLSGIAEASGPSTMGLIGVALLSVGLLFKVGAVPFHSWLPDVYQGAPTPVTAFMASATKIAAFGALLRVCYVALPPLARQWQPAFSAVAVMTMVVGTITAISQNDVKRMLAYSSIAHTGFILTGVIALNASGLSGSLFYLFAYGFSTLGAFAIVSVVRRSDGDEESDLRRWAGLGRRYPFIGVVFSLFLLAFAGIPLTSGFVSKFAVFKAAAEGGAASLVVVGVIASAVAAYFYVRVIVLMFFTEPPADAPAVDMGTLSRAMIVLTAAVTLFLGALPQPLLDLANSADHFVR